jgi:MFS transporter, PAT family, beta-lactamase induction signal transducer AmpG
MVRLPDSSASRKNSPWLFGLLGIPNGLANAVIVVLMPYLLRQHGVAVDRIAEIVALASIPNVWYFLYSPMVDMGLPRRMWILAGATTAGTGSAIAILLTPISLTAVTISLFLAAALGSVISSANGALLTFLQPSVRGRASGWYQAGNLGAGTVGGGLAIWLADRLSLPLLAVSSAALVILPAMAAFLVKEEPIPHKAITTLFADLFHDLREVLRSKRTRFGLVFFLSPVSSAAVANLISGLGPDYHAPANEVMWVSGIGGGLLSAFGSFVGGFVCDRMNRMAAYTLAGGLSAVFAAHLAFAPPTAWTYGLGYSGYAIAAGFGYAVFTALVLEVLGRRRHAAGTAYSLMVASGNVPILYMTYLDGVGYRHGAVRGLMSVDAVANGVGAVLLLMMAGYARRHFRQQEEPAPTAP